MRHWVWLLWLVGLCAGAQAEVEVVRSKLARARAALSNPAVTEDERRALQSKLDAADKALDAYVKVLTRGDQRTAAVAPFVMAGGAILADDATGVGVADDPLLPIILLGGLLAHAATPSPATEPEISKAWIALSAALAAASTTAIELARKKKPGCYCYCLRPGKGKLPTKRVDTPDQCRSICEDDPGEWTGHLCGGDPVWW